MRRNCGAAVSLWLERWVPRIRAGGSVLDVACGGGRNGRRLADLGFRVTGVDRDLEGVADLRDRAEFEWIEADLETGDPPPFVGRTFDAVVVTNYLWRPILPDLFDAVGVDGLLIYETFAVGNEAFGRPRNPDFLLRPGELLRCRDHGLEVVAYEHGERPDPRRVVQRIAATRHPAPLRLG